MANQVVWNDRYNLGVDVIDKEHKKLFGILNRLFDFGEHETKNRWVCQEAVKYFKNHTLQHFDDEENYMFSIGYEGMEMHKRIHNNFKAITLPSLEKELTMTGYSEEALNHFIGVCAGWLIGHTMIEDHAIVSGEILEKWENLMSEDEQALMGDVIVSQLYTMFQLDSQLISNCYGGEKFGKAVYYRLVYTTKEKKKWEFLLVLEERLIINTLGSALNTKSNGISVMLMNAARYTSRQFIEHFKGHFPELDEAKIDKEQLLSYNQFQRIFEKNKPQFSFLFDTGEGYLAHCMAAVDMTPNVDAPSIVTENAMSTVEEYIKQSEEEQIEISHKKKILIVDDSEFMLKTLHQLFSKEYELLTAMSGLSAFRSITLDRPDLIILDYEMPVCNGQQVFEMIRAEEEFADIPVIFLTSNVERESVKKIVELKPQGYLLKSLPLDAIKAEIDKFFKKKG